MPDNRHGLHWCHALQQRSNQREADARSPEPGRQTASKKFGAPLSRGPGLGIVITINAVLVHFADN